jgi:Flp pilus assembly protein TadD
MKALDNKRWAQAEKELRRAVTIHPGYAPAWSALGEALGELSRPEEARASWVRAIQADPRYVKRYVQLARLAVREGRMEDAIRITDRAIVDRYTQSLPVYFYNAVANLAVGRLDAAEKSARKAMELDPGHTFPKCENLLGTVLAAKGDRQGAAEHMKKYLEFSPKSEDAPKVKQRITELER